MKRILFVDDEPSMLQGLQNVLGKCRSDLDMVFVPSGDAALKELRKTAFDVVVSDMRMPGMDGATLLQKVKEEFPDTVRIILSARVERSAVFKAIHVSHQFLPKPCDAETLGNVIDRSCKLRELLGDESLRKEIGALEKLPSLPKVYQELMDLMSRPYMSTAMVAAIIDQDSAMSAKILQLVNSACFGVSRSIGQINQAVVFLGIELVKNLALTVHVFSSLKDRSAEATFEALQEHALLTARIAKQLLHDEQQAQQAFTASLLHDIGRVVLMICIPERYRAVVQAAHSAKRPLHEVEQEILGVNHATAGAYLLGLWGLPYPIVEAVAYHHNPADIGETTFAVASATALADSLVDSMTDPQTSTIDRAHLENLGVLESLPRWMEIAEQEVGVRN